MISASPVCAWLGRQAYASMWHRLQQQAADLADGKAEEVVWSCEHDPVYTTGRRGIDNRVVDRLPAPLLQVDRGGETTFHGPGQIMLYPVIHLRRRGMGVRQYVAILEQSCIDLLSDYGIAAERRCGFPGVWVVHGEAGVAKVAALGVRVVHGVAYHGMALNVSVEPSWFAAINPCGTGSAVVNAAGLAALPADAELADRWMRRVAALL